MLSSYICFTFNTHLGPTCIAHMVFFRFAHIQPTWLTPMGPICIAKAEPNCSLPINDPHGANIGSLHGVCHGLPTCNPTINHRRAPFLLPILIPYIGFTCKTHIGLIWNSHMGLSSFAHIQPKWLISMGPICDAQTEPNC